MLTHAWSGSHWARLGRRAKERRARVREPAAGVAGEEPAIDERLELRQGRAIEDWRRRHAEQRCPFDDLSNLVLPGPPVDDGTQFRSRLIRPRGLSSWASSMRSGRSIIAASRATAAR